MDAHSLEAGTLVVLHIRGQEAEHGGGVDTVVLIEEAPARTALHTWTRSRSHFSVTIHKSPQPTYPDLSPLGRGDVLVRHQPLEVVHLGPGVELEQDGALLLARELRLPEIFLVKL